MKRRQQTLLSAGIDIGTSTTKMIISRLIMQNTAGQTQVPRIEIIDQETIYKSPIFRTPLVDDVTIDVKAIEQLVFEQYRLANILPSDIQTGAILITGETATKSNASELIHHLSDAAGEFLVATAGPDLESILAARGSGAVAYSKKTGRVVANIDIGGGTTNIAVLQHGEVIGTVTLHMGGRLIAYEQGHVKEIAPSVQRLLTANHMRYNIGMKRDMHIESFVVQQMVRSLNAVLRAEQNPSQIPMLLGHVANWQLPIDTILFSGGVSQCIYPRADSNCEMGEFDDIGRHIAKACMANSELQQFEWMEPLETVRATVMGAGAQSTDVSGATIEVDGAVLPLKNVPVLQCDFSHTTAQMTEKVAATILQAEQLFDNERSGDPFALYFKQIPYMNFNEIVQLADAIVQHWPLHNRHILLVLEADYAKVLGQTLLKKTTTHQIVCIDQVFVRTGDYIDIGKPLDAGVVPVVVKTLAFHRA